MSCTERIAQLKALQLFGMADACQSLQDQAQRRPLPVEVWLDRLIEAEQADRQARSLRYQLKAARFPIHRDLAGFNWQETPLPRAQIEQLASAGFMHTAHNLILVGGTGTGKTHLASALGVAAIHAGKRVRFYNAVDLVNQLEKEKQLAATEAVLKGEEKERTRLAKDLHDGLGGMLSGIKYSLNTMKGNLIMTPENHQAFERSMDMLDSSIKEMRRVAHNMMPEALVKFGLDTALRDFCNDINQSGALRVTYQSIGLQDASIDQTTGITIYRIVQELINNTMKHAAARTAIVQLSGRQHLLTVTVEDDGKGFDTSILRQAGGIGWSNIINRVEFLKGKLDIDSQPGKGTSVHIELDA